MTQTKLGSQKAVAKHLGITLEDLLTKLEEGLKRCRKCHTWKPRDRFVLDRHRGDGLATVCRDCSYSRKTSKPGRNERLQKRSEGLAWCRLCQNWLPMSDVYNGLCRSHIRQMDRERYASDDSYRAERRQHVYSRKRNIGPIPIVGQEFILEEFGGICAYCESPATTWDHIIPVKNGGQTVPWNIVPACRSCNSSKNSRDVMDWLRTKGVSRLPYEVLDRLLMEFIL